MRIHQSCVKENGKTFSKNPTTFYIIKNTKSVCWGNTESSFQENARTFPQNSTNQNNIKNLKLEEDCNIYTKKEHFKLASNE